MKKEKMMKILILMSFIRRSKEHMRMTKTMINVKIAP